MTTHGHHKFHGGVEVQFIVAKKTRLLILCRHVVLCMEKELCWWGRWWKLLWLLRPAHCVLRCVMRLSQRMGLFSCVLWCMTSPLLSSSPILLSYPPLLLSSCSRYQTTHLLYFPYHHSLSSQSILTPLAVGEVLHVQYYMWFINVWWYCPFYICIHWVVCSLWYDDKVLTILHTYCYLIVIFMMF